MRRPIAILSFHSHADRSFLDDRELALLSGDLRDAGIENDLVAAVLGDEGALAEALEPYGIVIYERVWSTEVIERLRAALPGRTFVSCEGEHALADPPADYVCWGELRASVPALITYLRGGSRAPSEAQRSEVSRSTGGSGGAPPPEGSALPRCVRAREKDGWREGLGKLQAAPRTFAPNVKPVWIGPRPGARTFSIQGNPGCPYQADARDNPLYEGTDIPAGYGRGCAFCTTGNESEIAPPDETAEKVLAQIRYLRTHAPELERLVVKDQNPFAWLARVVEQCRVEGRSGFSLLLETRADWFLRSEARFERVLVAAESAGIRICPFLVGIENFSQPELDRFNKGTTAETNERFLSRIHSWADRHASFDLSHASFGFVLLSPWTTMADLRTNLEAVERTGFDRLRGHLLVSRARLYPDTALYYLARRDGLLEQEHASAAADNSRRYGYFPAAPWRFSDPTVARFAELASELTARFGGRDQVRIWRALLDVLDRSEHASIDDVLAELDGDNGVRERFARLVAPLALDARFADGWRFGELVLAQRRVTVRLEHEEERAVALEIAPRRGRASFARSRHYDMRHAANELTPAQERAVRTVCDAIARNDR